VQQLEQEVKLEVEPEVEPADLTGLFPGVAAVALPVLSLDAVYYDTADTRLARHHITCASAVKWPPAMSRAPGT